MLETIKIVEMILSILLILIVVLQPKGEGLSLSSSGNFGKFEKRGPEKVLHNTTIILGAAFIIDALLYFFLA